MKKNCEIVKDLLPLYLDKVCSKESNALVEEHLRTCKECQNYLEGLKYNVKTSSKKEKKIFKNFNKKIYLKILRNSVIITLIIVLVVASFGCVLGRSKVMEYNDKMSIEVYSNNKGREFTFESNISGIVEGVRINTTYDGVNTNLIFVHLKSTLREYLERKEEARIGTIINNLDYKMIDPKVKVRVYYTTEDLDKIKNASEEDLEDIIQNANLMFTEDLKTTKINCNLDGKDYEYSLTYYKVSDQIVDSVEDYSLPSELIRHIYSIYGDYDSVWFTGETATEVFSKTERYMISNGGSCTRTDIE